MKALHPSRRRIGSKIFDGFENVKNHTLRPLGWSVGSCALISLCENGKKREPTRDLVEACADVLGFHPEFFYGQLEEVFREDECSFRHRRSAPERLKTQVRARATLVGMVINRLRSSFKFPAVDVPHIPARSFGEVEEAGHSKDCSNTGALNPALDLTDESTI